MQSGNNSQAENYDVSRKGKNLVVTVASAIILGAIGSGIWEVMFRPGLSTLGNFFSNISSDFENSIYASAALDPQPIPGLILILLICTIPLFFCSLFLFKGFLQLPLENFLDAHFDKNRSSAESYQVRRNKFLRFRQIICLAGVLMSLFFATITLKGFALQNEAILVWRVFHANLEICAAFAPDSEIRRLNSNFRLMKNKSDYRSIKKQLKQLATEAKVPLVGNW